MRTWKILLAITLASLHPVQGTAQDLEDTIEDELDSGVADGEQGELDPIEEELEGEEEVAKKPSKKADAKQKAAPAPAPTVEDQAEQDAADAAEFGEEIESDVDDVEEQQAETTPEEEIEEPSTEEPETEVTEETPEEAPEETPEETVEAEEEKPKNIYAETLGGFDDNVNTEFERRIYRIFNRSAGIGDEQWTTMVAPVSSGIYRVQRGDTLWDISRTFFGDGNFWPRLWSENARLTNPHEIRVGKGVAFVAGTEEDAPAVAITDVRLGKGFKVDKIDPESEPSTPVYPDDPEAQLNDEDVAAGTVLEEQPIVGGRPEIPEPLTGRQKILRRLPPSFVEPVPPKIEREYDNTGLDVGRRRAVDEPAVQHLDSYLSDGKPESVGRVDEIESQEKTAGYLQHVLIRMDRDVSPGQRFSAVMLRGSISHSKSRTYGPVVEIGGGIEITQVLDAGKRLYRAVVLKSINPIEIGAMLVEQPLPTASYSRRARLSEVEARVIGGEYDSDRKLLGPGSVIYLDKGTSNGMVEGQLIAVRAIRGERREDTNYPDIGTPVAVLKIARCLERVCTAMILDSYGEVKPGDLTGGPVPRPARQVANGGRKRAMNIGDNMEQNDDAEFKEEFDDADELESELE